MSASRRIVVIGGGASGLMAAIAAARRGARVTILERMQRVGKKLLATGNGRCNLTNLYMAPDHYHGGIPRFALDVIERFDVARTMEFFQDLGLALRTESDGKVYPATDQATAVLDLMRDELERLGVETVCEAAAQRILHEGGKLVCVTLDDRRYAAERVIVAAGGKSSPNLGSNGAGFKLAESLGHQIITPVPALVQMRINAPFLKALQGVRVQAAAEFWIGQDLLRRAEGEILFTDYGLSGIPIMDLSRLAAPFAERGSFVTIRLDLFPGETEDALARAIERRVELHPQRTIEFGFVGLLHKRIIPIALRAAGVEDLNARFEGLGRGKIRDLARLLKGWPLACIGTQSWMFSQVTAGGVDVRQVDRRTLESKLAPGVHFCGEVLDVDGDCGGYNLQWAWSSGYIAGEAAAG